MIRKRGHLSSLALPWCVQNPEMLGWERWDGEDTYDVEGIVENHRIDLYVPG